MAKVRLSIQAQADFNDILDYLSEVAGHFVAARYAKEIQTIVNLLTDFPEMGARRPEPTNHTRFVAVHPYLIFYETHLEKNEVAVLRILHGARNITAELIKPAD